MRLTRIAGSGFALLLSAGIAVAEQSIEERVRNLEIQMEKSESAPAAATSTATPVELWFEDGLRFKSSDKSITGRIGGCGIFHYTYNAHLNEADGKIDTFSIRQACIELQIRLWNSWEAYIRPQFFSGGSNLFLGWVEFNRWEAFKIRVGLFKEPYSQELIEDIRWQDMPENSLVNITVPARDLGAMIFGTPIEGGILNYWLGVFNGNGVAGTDNNSDKDLCARLALRPGAKSESDAFKHLTFAIDATHGRAGETSGTPFAFTTPATGTTFHSGPVTFDSNEDRTRLGADLVWIWGPFSLKSEYSWVKSVHDFAGGDHAVFRAKAWMADAGIWMFGSTRLNNKRPDIRKPLFKDGGIGDIQFVVRYSQLRLGDTFEDRAGWGGSRNVKEYAAGLNYYPNPYVRISAMFVHYRYDHQDSREFLTANGRVLDDENAVVLRAQVDF